jgi:tetratricopeptide (TPR) repeat protein
MPCLSRVALVVLAASVALSPAFAADLRDKYGTTSLKVAQHIDSGIALAEAHQPVEALKEIEAALAIEPKNGMALYWRATVLLDLGKVEEAITAYGKTYEIGLRVPNNMSVDAAINLGLLYAKLGQGDPACEWFSKAISADPLNVFRTRGKAWRNMAITNAERKQYLSAAIQACFAHVDDPEHAPEQMIADFSRRAEPEECASILRLPGTAEKVPAREAVGPMIPVDQADLDIPQFIDRLLCEPK